MFGTFGTPNPPRLPSRAPPSLPSLPNPPRSSHSEAAEVADRLSPSGRHQADWDPQQVRVEPLISRASIQQPTQLKITTNNAHGRATTIKAASLRPDLCDTANVEFKAASDRETSAVLTLTLRANTPRGRHIIPLSVTADDQPLPSDTFAVLIVE